MSSSTPTVTPATDSPIIESYESQMARFPTVLEPRMYSFAEMNAKDEKIGELEAKLQTCKKLFTDCEASLQVALKENARLVAANFLVAEAANSMHHHMSAALTTIAYLTRPSTQRKSKTSATNSEPHTQQSQTSNMSSAAYSAQSNKVKDRVD